MARYIDADLAKAEFTGNFQDEYSPAHIKALIDNMPTADVIEVVRTVLITKFAKLNNNIPKLTFVAMARKRSVIKWLIVNVV